PKPKEKAKEIPYGRVILANVKFEGGGAELAPGSEAELERVYNSLVDWPDIKIEIQVHTDNTLPPKKALELSEKRAQVIYNYFKEKGISEERLKAVGKGSEDPIADNSSIYGRRLNNRVELRRIDEKDK
ncbi:MAG: OmpA family protein, partial [Chitinispirillaceae bacterium]|nr:OmpA family protein [Chitinispirillaceae bacterium]